MTNPSAISFEEYIERANILDKAKRKILIKNLKKFGFLPK